MLHISKRFPQKRAFVTGAGSGLGREFAKLLAADGWALGLTDINPNALSETVGMLGGNLNVQTCVFDVSDEQAYKMHAEKFLAMHKGIDLLINNAGVGDGAMFEEYSLENWKWIVGINQMGVIYGCHFFVPQMKLQQQGCIINIASAAAFAASGTMSAYSATKAAVLSLSETLFAELKSFNINVSVVMPTFFKTNIMQYHRGSEEARQIGNKMIEKSDLEANEVASKILNAAAKGKFYIVLPFVSKFLFAFKRLMPSLFIRFTALAFKHRDRLKR